VCSACRDYAQDKEEVSACKRDGSSSSERWEEWAAYAEAFDELGVDALLGLDEELQNLGRSRPHVLLVVPLAQALLRRRRRLLLDRLHALLPLSCGSPRRTRGQSH
jgi:hypothetical protein